MTRRKTNPRKRKKGKLFARSHAQEIWSARPAHDNNKSLKKKTVARKMGIKASFNDCRPIEVIKLREKANGGS